MLYPLHPYEIQIQVLQITGSLKFPVSCLDMKHLIVKEEDEKKGEGKAKDLDVAKK